MEKMPACEEVPAKELAVAFGGQVVGYWLPILDTLVEATYLVDQEELNGMGEADPRRISS